jgi:hypothetical protein
MQKETRWFVEVCNGDGVVEVIWFDTRAEYQAYLTEITEAYR